MNIRKQKKFAMPVSKLEAEECTKRLSGSAAKTLYSRIAYNTDNTDLSIPFCDMPKFNKNRHYYIIVIDGSIYVKRA